MALPVSSASADYTAIRSYSIAPGAIESNDFAVTINGVTPLFVEKCQYLSYTRLALTSMPGTIKIEVKARLANLDSVTLYPKRLRLDPAVDKPSRTITFTLDASLTTMPRQFVLKVNDAYIAIFMDPPEMHPPGVSDANVKSIMDFGIDATGATVQTAILQQALDWMRDNTEGKTILYFPRGVYTCGTVKAAGNLQIYLQEDARIQGSPALSDYDGALIMVNGNHAGAFRLFGRGVIDGNGTPIFMAHKHQGNCLLQIANCPSVVLNDIILRDSICWACHTKQCSNVRIHNVKVINPSSHNGKWEGNHFWNDSFDASGCTDYRNDNCFAWSNDDCIAVMSIDRATAGVTFNNLLGHTNASGVRIGWNSSSAIDALRFAQCEFIQTPYNAISFHELKNGARYGETVFEDCRFGGENNIEWRDEKIPGYVFFKVYGPDFGDGTIRADAIVLRRCIIEKEGPALYIGNPASGIKRVVYENVQIATKRVKSIEDIKDIACVQVASFAVC